MIDDNQHTPGDRAKSRPWKVWKKLLRIATSGTFWGGVGALAGVAAAVAAFITISASNRIRQEELESRRPYFVITNPHFSLEHGADSLLLNINIMNGGVRPAANVDYEMKVTPVHEVHGKEAPENALSIDGEHRFQHSSDLPKGIPFPWWLDYPRRPEIAPLYFRLVIRYDDGLLHKTYAQTVYMKWDGVVSGNSSPNLTFASKKQADAIEAHLRR